MRKLARICIICVLALVVLALIPALINGNFQSEPDTTIPPEIDQNALITDASAYFERMCKGDFSTFHEALPSGIKSQTTPEDIKSAWEEEADKMGVSPSLDTATVTLYRPEFSDQLRVEFSIPGEKGDFCFFINYTLEGSLYNYVVWVH